MELADGGRLLPFSFDALTGLFPEPDLALFLLIGGLDPELAAIDAADTLAAVAVAAEAAAVAAAFTVAASADCISGKL